MLAGLADSDGKLEVGPDLISRGGSTAPAATRTGPARGEPGGIWLGRNPGRGQRPRAQFSLSHLPQVGFGALKVHVP